MKKLEEILSKLSYVIIIGLAILLVFVRPVQLNSQSIAIPPHFTEEPLIWWPVDNISVYVAFGIAVAILLYYRRVFLTQWPGRHIVTIGLAIAAFGFAYVKSTEAYVAGFADRLEVSQPTLTGRDIETIPMRRVGEVKVSCIFKSVRKRPTYTPAYWIYLADGRQLNLFSGYKGNNRDEAVAAVARIDEAIRKNGIERLAAEQNGPGSSSFRQCMEGMKTRISPENYELFEHFMVKTADKSTFLRTL